MEICEEGNSTIETTTPSNGTHIDDVDVNVDEEHNSNEDHDHDDQPTKQEVDPTAAAAAIFENLESLDLHDNGQSTDLEDEKEKEKEVKTQKYPLRNNAVDCAYYTKTGSCKYGSNCMFNHPLKRVVQVFKVVGEKEKVNAEEKNELVSDTDKTECKYFSTPGGCKYGDACKYAHITKKVEEEGPELNFLGLPIRPLEKECTFFMRYGTCGYGATCVFHHPNPSVAKEYDDDSNSPKTHETWHSSEVSQGASPWFSDTNLRNTTNTDSYQGTPQISERSCNQATTTLNKPSLPHQIVKTTHPATHHEHLMHIEEFPERPGQPDCDYFMRTGDCKYRSTCRYNHPFSRGRKLHLPPPSAEGSHFRSAKVLPVDYTDIPYSKSNNTRRNEPFPHHHHHQQMQNGEYPERPGQPECEYFMKNGDCKFKSSCRYHHPRNRVSTSSFSEKGLPLRPGIKVCRNFQQNGTCKYGRICQFHHPNDFGKTFALQDHGSARVLGPAADLDSPTSNNTESEWGDTWVI